MNAEQILEEAKKRIMPWEEYVRRCDAADLFAGGAYVYECAKGKKRVLNIGAAHTHDPASELFPRIDALFAELSPEIVFVEGVSKVNAMTREQLLAEISWLGASDRGALIREHGESGYIGKKALEAGARLWSPEPTDRELLDASLAAGFSEEELLAHELALVAPQWKRVSDNDPKAPGLEEYMERFLGGFQKMTSWEGFDYSFAHAKEILIESAKKWNPDFDFEKELAKDGFNDSLSTPVELNTRLNEIARFQTRIRDERTLADLAKFLETNDRILIVYGGTHSVMLEPAIRYYLESSF